MAIRDVPPQPVPFEEIEGTIWGDVAQLAPGKPDGPRRTSIVPVVPQGGQQTVVAGDSAVYDLAGEYRATRLQLSIPEDMEAHLFIDGRNILSVNDGQGMQGSYDLATGDGDFMQVRQAVQIQVTNNAGVAQDVQVGLVVSL